ncbi:hypothetical protein QOT17_009111 [Balamuthia mandrillaris]
MFSIVRGEEPLVSESNSGAALCLLSFLLLMFIGSILYHTFMPTCSSAPSYERLLKFDVTAAVIGMTGSAVSFVLWGYRCWPSWYPLALFTLFLIYALHTVKVCLFSRNIKERAKAMGLFLLLRVSCGALCSYPRLSFLQNSAPFPSSSPPAAPWLSSFMGDNISGLIIGEGGGSEELVSSPHIHLYSHERVPTMTISPALWYHSTAFLFVFVGGVINALRWPECWLPGRFDFTIHSHGFWHLFGLIASVLTCWGTLQDLADWDSAVCPAGGETATTPLSFLGWW